MRKDNYRRYEQAESVPTRTILQHPTKPNLFFPVHRRVLRLPDVDYSSVDCLCFVTFNVNRACGVLLTEENGPLAWDALQQQLQQLDCTVYAACMMPDHAHLLVAPSGKGESISDIVGRVKSCMCLALRIQRQCYLKWQPSFYDHVLRDTERGEEEMNAIVHYIRANPAKADLGDDYPYLL
jgi:REP element-mobilizing transposase RayT